MKKLLALIMILGMMLATAQADCLPMYKKYKVKAVVNSTLLTTGGAGGVALGAVAVYVGAIIGITASSEGIMLLGTVAGGLSAATGVVLTVSSVKSASRFVSLFKALKLIKESQVGSGDHLNELADDLNDQYDLSGEAAVTPQKLAALIAEGNNVNQFCLDSKNLYGRKVMVEYLVTKLGLR
ncbi:MAG: hypothetical protein A2X86_01160 [Bdellovibrionales bacterium GWA2_49_15]|nr:MAG: hypothetical protein A2X86_01160 [Bdellovibrionales bacterium GWA2_49_15]HAZ12167.1 hypothetical protein [Bdellovibrionales bacterium]